MVKGGNVGIGTADPGTKLDVAGNLRLSATGARDIQSYTGAAYTDLNYDALSHNWQTGGGTAKMVLSNSGNLGIGTTSPGGKLAIYSGASGASATAGANDLIIEGNEAGGTGESILFPDAYSAYLSFSTPSGSHRGAIGYFGAAYGTASYQDSMVLRANNSDAVIINKNGNVGIGTTAPAARLAVQMPGDTDGTLVGTFGDAARTYAEFYTGSDAANPNAANAVLKVRKSNASGRSISASGTINASGADYAEWIPWEGERPGAGAVIKYKGSYMVVSSSGTAAFTGNDLYGEGGAILLAFIGQVPVRLRGPVRQGDYVVPNDDGTAGAVARGAATFAQYREALGTAWEANEAAGVKTVLVAVGVK